MVTGESVGIMKYKFQIYKIHLVFGHLSALFENITIKCAAMESRLKHAGWNKRADWNFPQKTINVQDLIRACRVVKKFEINKRACTFIRYSRVPKINPIPGGLWNYVVRRGGAIMARMDFRLSKVAKRPVSTQNLLSNIYFNL